MSRHPWIAIAAVIAIVALGGAPARADDPYRIVLSRVDPANFPTVRFVASVVDETEEFCTVTSPPAATPVTWEPATASPEATATSCA